MTRPRSALPSARRVDERHTELELARVRQELRMRSFVLAVVIGILLACTASAIIEGPSVGNVGGGVGSASALAWIVRRLFPLV